METEFVKCQVRDYIAQVTKDRPPVNAVNAQVHPERMQVFDALGYGDDVRVAILTGAGRVFCAGADITARLEHAPQTGDFWQHSRRARESFHSIVECKVPAIAAINGSAPDAGLGLVACMTATASSRT